MLTRVTGKDPEKGVNPDECVAVGAAYWAAIVVVRCKCRQSDHRAAADAHCNRC